MCPALPACRRCRIWGSCRFDLVPTASGGSSLRGGGMRAPPVASALGLDHPGPGAVFTVADGFLGVRLARRAHCKRLVLLPSYVGGGLIPPASIQQLSSRSTLARSHALALFRYSVDVLECLAPCVERAPHTTLTGETARPITRAGPSGCVLTQGGGVLGQLSLIPTVARGLVSVQRSLDRTRLPDRTSWWAARRGGPRVNLQLLSPWLRTRANRLRGEHLSTSCFFVVVV